MLVEPKMVKVCVSQIHWSYAQIMGLNKDATMATWS
jgi:hypothetical protein